MAGGRGLDVVKELGKTQPITCSSCKTVQCYSISRHRTWRTVLGIPVFVRSTGYTYACPGCGNSYPLVKQQVRYMLKRAGSGGNEQRK